MDVGARARVEGAGSTGRWGRLLASLISRLIIFYVRLTRRVAIRGALPGAPCVAVSFHRSYWDGLLVCMLDPRITAVTSRAWKSIMGAGWYLENYGVIWTEEDVVARATTYVREGGICWLAPCGFSRSGECPKPHSGAAQIAAAAGTPVVCVTLVREAHHRSLPRRRRLTVVIGEPLRAAATDTVETVTERLVAALGAQERQTTASADT